MNSLSHNLTVKTYMLLSPTPGQTFSIYVLHEWTVVLALGHLVAFTAGSNHKLVLVRKRLK